MYQQVEGLGFSLKPPAWARKALEDLARGRPTTVPSPGGGTVVISPPMIQQGAPTTPPPAGVEAVPGGWVTIAGAALLAILVLPRLFRGRG